MVLSHRDGMIKMWAVFDAYTLASKTDNTGVVGSATQSVNGVDAVSAEAAVVELKMTDQATGAGDIEIKLGENVIATITVAADTTIEGVVDLIVAQNDNITDFVVTKKDATTVLFTANDKKVQTLTITLADK